MIIPVMCSVKKTYTITVKSSDVGKLTVYPIYKEFYRDLEREQDRKTHSEESVQETFYLAIRCPDSGDCAYMNKE